VEGTSGASHAARGSTGTPAAHGAGEERRGKRMHPSPGRRGLHTVCGGGQTAQYVVRVSDMDGGRDLSAPRDQQLAHMHPFRGGCLLGQLRQESRGVVAESTKFRQCGCKGDSSPPPSTCRTWSSQHGVLFILVLFLWGMLLFLLRRLLNISIRC
jgi:hypothetical protein